MLYIVLELGNLVSNLIFSAITNVRKLVALLERHTYFIGMNTIYKRLIRTINQIIFLLMRQNFNNLFTFGSYKFGMKTAGVDPAVSVLWQLEQDRMYSLLMLVTKGSLSTFHCATRMPLKLSKKRIKSIRFKKCLVSNIGRIYFIRYTYSQSSSSIQ